MILTHKEKVIREQLYHQRKVQLGHLKRANQSGEKFDHFESELRNQGIDVDKIKFDDSRFRKLDEEIREEKQKLY